jgi:gamma-glutamyltranspeptidase/glutathione hydrolase
MVITRYGVVATEHPLASQIGASVLADGGNAVDAAVAANAATGVLAPMANGIGGDLFAIVYDAKSGKLYGLNASGWSPAALTPEHVLTHTTERRTRRRSRQPDSPSLQSSNRLEMPQSGINSVTIPGVVDGWDKLIRRFGKKKLSYLLAPAIRYADEGFPVTELFASYWAASASKLQADSNAAKTFLPNGRAPRIGEVFRNPDVAASLRLIAKHGSGGFYRGEIAKKIVACSKEHDGVISVEDLADYSSEWVQPISTTYHDWTVFELPPNGQGLGALEMLNLMEGFPIKDYGLGSAPAFHVMIEAKKLAYADVLHYLADPGFLNRENLIPSLLSKTYALERAKLINLTNANCNVEAGTPPPMGNDTTYLCVVDAEGNMVSYIQSNYSSFGSGLVPPGTGFALQNRGGLFSLDPASPNVLAGHKRPLHTIIPAFMSKGTVRIAFGIMGGWNQSQAHAQFVSDVVDHGLNIQAALEAPRFTKLTFDGCDVEIEARIPQSVRDDLASRGHKLQVRGPFTSSVGGGQAVLRDFKTGVNYGASDPRKDGAAIPQPMVIK